MLRGQVPALPDRNGPVNPPVENVVQPSMIRARQVKQMGETEKALKFAENQQKVDWFNRFASAFTQEQGNIKTYDDWQNFFKTKVAQSPEEYTRMQAFIGELEASERYMPGTVAQEKASKEAQIKQQAEDARLTDAAQAKGLDLTYMNGNPYTREQIAAMNMTAEQKADLESEQTRTKAEQTRSEETQRKAQENQSMLQDLRARGIPAEIIGGKLVSGEELTKLYEQGKPKAPTKTEELLKGFDKRTADYIHAKAIEVTDDDYGLDAKGMPIAGMKPQAQAIAAFKKRWGIDPVELLSSASPNGQTAAPQRAEAMTAEQVTAAEKEANARTDLTPEQKKAVIDELYRDAGIE